MAFGNRQSSGLPLEGGTMSGAINMGTNNITSAGDIVAANANGYKLVNAASTATVPTVVHNRADTTSGLGGSTGQFSQIISSIAQVSTITGQSWAPNATMIMSGAAANGAVFYHTQLATTLLSGMNGATVTATNLIPAGSIVYGIVLRVNTTITGCTSFQVGDGTDVDRWGNALALASGTTTSAADFTTTNSAAIYTAATSVVLTAVGGGASFTAGAVRLNLYYAKMTAPTA